MNLLIALALCLDENPSTFPRPCDRCNRLRLHLTPIDKKTLTPSYIVTTSDSFQSTTVSKVLPLSLQFRLGLSTALL